MKAITIQNELEMRLEIKGDSFYQGDVLLCTVAVKNLGKDIRDCAGIFLSLAATPSKAKGKDTSSIVSDSVLKERFSLSPGESAYGEIEIPLSECSRITDQSTTMQFFYGVDTSEDLRAKLPITILPHRFFIQIIEIFSSAFGFIDKQRKWKDGSVEFKFKPSSDKRFTLLDELLVACSLRQEELLLHYTFKVKSLESAAVSVKFKKEVKEFDSALLLRSVLLTPQQLDSDRVERAIAEALEQVHAGI